MPQERYLNEDTYSEEVQEIMGHVPNWIVRWGITVFFLVFMMLLAGSYFFSYPVVISTPFILTTINPPAPVICKKSGRILQWFVAGGQKVKKGEVIAILENSASYEDIKLLDSLLKNLYENPEKAALKIPEPDRLILGQLQNTYVTFYKVYRNIKHYLEQDLIGKKITLLEKRIYNQKEQYDLILRQWMLKQQEFDVAEKVFVLDSIAYFKGGYGIIKTEYDRSLQSILSQKAALLAFESSVKNAELTLLQLKESLLDLKFTKKNDLNIFRNELDKNRTLLQTGIDEWVENYLLISPIYGKITLTKYWSENQVITAGERLATIVPDEETIIIARAFIPSSGLGKVKPGQKVNIKLAGFPYMEYGVINGVINTISLIPEKEGYVAEIKLTDGMTSSYSETLKFIQQMDGTADIITEDTRLIYRLISPLRSYLQN